MAGDRLPKGIYFRSGQTAPDFFRLATFNFEPTAAPETARAAIETIWDVIADLKRGIVRDLNATKPEDPTIRIEPGDLEATLCYGRRLFDPTGRQTPLVAELKRPWHLPPLRTYDGPFRSLRWGPTAEPEAAQTDFAIMLNGATELSVARALVEIQKAIDDHALPLRIVCFFAGLHRDDRRSWIDFHDGINNMEASQRQIAIEITQGPDWLLGGATMAFLKIAIDLQGWRKLPREIQEALVGRDKLSGCPIADIDVDVQGKVTLRHVPGCPMKREIGLDTPELIELRQSPIEPIVKTSHIHRANQSRTPPDMTDTPNRIFRQGYEFVDSPPGGGLRIGLNFVSFQRHIERVTDILDTDGWLGDVNFGGIPGERTVPAFPLMSVVAGGLFVVPPVD
ncbi:MAG TPA: hypothetical protein VHG52_08695, partial [Thermomicrobiales bacterium]|nr:hypothetical protein [Thermomicrobiales bacterium]